MSYDPKCHELARHFLPDGVSERLVSGLAQHVQSEIELWLECSRDDLLRELMAERKK